MRGLATFFAGLAVTILVHDSGAAANSCACPCSTVLASSANFDESDPPIVVELFGEKDVPSGALMVPSNSPGVGFGFGGFIGGFGGGRGDSDRGHGDFRDTYRSHGEGGR